MQKFFYKLFKNLDEHTLEVVQKSLSSSVVKVGGMIAGFLLSIFLGRTLGADGLGIINLSNTIINLLVVVCLLGTRQIIVREVALGLSKENLRHIGSIMKSAYVLNGSFTLALSIFLIILAPWITQEVFDEPRLKWPLIIGLIVVTPQIFARIWSSGLIGYRKIWQSNLVDQALSIIITFLTIGVVCLFGFKITIINTAIAYAFGRAFVSISVGFYWNKLNTKVSKIKIEPKKLFRTSSPLLISSISNILISNADIILLGLFMDIKVVGLYTVASRIALLSGFLLQITNSALSGNLAALYSQNRKKELQILIQRTTKYLSIFAIFPLLIFFFAGKEILSLWGEEFIASYWVLFVLAVGQFFNIATGAAGQLLIMCGFQKEQSFITTSFLIINIILNIILINYYGVLGAAFTTAFTTAGVNITRVVVAKQKTGVLTLPI